MSDEGGNSGDGKVEDDESPKVRPRQTTLEGMIYNAHHVLDKALEASKGSGGIPKDLLSSCHGVVLLSIVETGLIFSGSVGTGVMMSHYPKWNEWSPPSAVSLRGVGFGFFVGRGARDVIVLIMDPNLKESVRRLRHVRFGGDSDTGGGTSGSGGHGSADFIEGSHSFVYSDGFFLGLNLGTAVLSSREKENERFYGKKVSPREILFEGAVSTAPSNTNGKGVQELHDKLELLKGNKVEGRKGGIVKAEMVPMAEFRESLRVEAVRAAEEAEPDQVDELEYVDSAKEAEKEGDDVNQARAAAEDATERAAEGDVDDEEEEKEIESKSKNETGGKDASEGAEEGEGTSGAPERRDAEDAKGAEPGKADE